MEIVYINDSVISKEELKELKIKSISIISETDIHYPRLIIKYENGIKKYHLIEDHIPTQEKFRDFLEEKLPELK